MAEIDQTLWKHTRSVRRQPGPVFEPDQPDPAPAAAPAVAGRQTHQAAPIKARRRTQWAWPVAWAMALAVAVVLGLVVGFARAGGEPASATVPTPEPARPPAPQPAPVPSRPVAVRLTASSACLETAKRADEIIDLLIMDRRDEAGEQLVAYTIASRQCRRDADP